MDDNQLFDICYLKRVAEILLFFIVLVPPCVTTFECANGGSVKVDDPDRCYCDCLEGYTGDHCESKLHFHLLVQLYYHQG